MYVWSTELCYQKRPCNEISPSLPAYKCGQLSRVVSKCLNRVCGQLSAVRSNRLSRIYQQEAKALNGLRGCTTDLRLRCCHSPWLSGPNIRLDIVSENSSSFEDLVSMRSWCMDMSCPSCCSNIFCNKASEAINCHFYLSYVFGQEYCI